MRILQVIPTYLPATRYGGPIFAVHGLGKALAKRGHEVSVFATSVDGAADSDVPIGRPLESDGVRVTYFRSRFLRRLFWSPEMGRALEAQAPSYDVLLLHSVFLWPTARAAQVARRSALPYVITPHGMLRNELIRLKNRALKTAWLKLVERRNLERAAAIHVTSTAERLDVERLGYSLRRVFVVPFGIDDPVPLDAADRETLPRPSGGRPLVVSLGRINWKKGLDRLILAMQHVPGACLAVAGNDDGGELRRLREMVRQLGLADRIEFPGALYGRDKAKLLAAGDVFVLPSYSENLGLAVLEALGAGMPAVVTPEVGLADDIREWRAGLVSEAEPERLGRALRQLLEDASLRAEMGANARRLVTERFGWASIAERMEQALLSVIPPGRRRESTPVA